MTVPAVIFLVLFAAAVAACAAVYGAHVFRREKPAGETRFRRGGPRRRIARGRRRAR